MNSKPSHILNAFMETPWAILPHKLAVLQEIVHRHVSGEKLTAEEIEARIHGASRPANRRVNSVAVLELFGTIFPRANLMTQMSGATSAEIFGAQFKALLDDPGVGAIVIDVNSPGGAVYGIDEVSKMIFDSRGQKPIVAVANHLMASAAYWIGTAANEVVVTPSGDVGSVGVFAIHEDLSGALEQEGINVSLISAGKFKVEGNPYQPLGEEARASIQASVDEVYDAFVAAVARNRGTNAAAVRNGFGEGRVVGAREAVRLGMADRIATLDETINRLLGNNVSGARSSASVPEEITEVAQEPASDSENSKPHLQEARARLAQVGNKPVEGELKMIRELLKERSEMVARAQALVDTADSENRDLTDEERSEFVQLLGAGESAGEVGALDVKIEQVLDERAKLREAMAKKFDAAEPEKPAAGAAAPKVLKLAEFNQLDPKARLAFIKAGGTLID